MSRIFKRFQEPDDEFTEEEIAAAEMIVESSGKKVVEAETADTKCFICGAVGVEFIYEPFKTNTGVYNIPVCLACKIAYKQV